MSYAYDIAIDWPTNIRISEIVVKCPRQNCDFKDELGMIENHMITCDKNPISCPFNEIGCKINEAIIDEMKAHLNEDNYCLSKLLIDLINNIRDEMESTKNENIELKKENSQFKQKFDDIKLQSTNQQQKMCEMETREIENRGTMNQELLALKNDCQSLRKEMEANIEMVQTESQKQIDELKKNYEQLQQQENKKDEMPKCANKIRLNQTKYEYEEFIKFGFLKLKIDKLSKKRMHWIYSKPFYSGPIEYKMCLAVNIESNGIVHIYLQSMHGVFNDKLEWPFQYDVTIDVINPGTGNICQSETIKYSDCPNNDKWKKPSNVSNSILFMINVPNN